MTDGTSQSQLPWAAANWVDEVDEWLRRRLATSGRQVTGPLEVVHRRAWAAFARIATDQGMVYFKAPAPPFYEIALTEFLARLYPEHTVPVLAAEHTRGWLLSADAGVTLRSLGQTEAQVEHWVRLLPEYSEFQMSIAGQVNDILEFGVPDRRLATFPELYARLLEDAGSLLLGLESGLTPEQHDLLLELRPRVADLCAELASYELPETLAHEELHENNVLLGDAGYIYTDWSDCSVAHPFFTMVVTLRAAAHWLKLPESGPEISRLRDAYLEPWTQRRSRRERDAALGIAYDLGMINRALSWHSALKALPAKDREAYADNVPGWLQDFLVAQADK